jgi:predicted aminopeptidase
MASIEARITALEAEIDGYRNDYAAATTEDRKDKLLGLITVSRQNLERLYAQLERQQQPQGKIICKIPIDGCSFNICCCLSI